MIIDHTKLNMQLNIISCFKTYRLMLIIFGISYFIGIVFFIFADLVNDIPISKPDYHEHFIQFYNLDVMSSFKQALILIYYAFTSLSTVGFGDYNPRSDAERCFIAMVLLFGVLTFSYAMGNFIEILDSIKRANSTFDDNDNLSRFFGLLKNFNQGSPIKQEFKI